MSDKVLVSADWCSQCPVVKKYIEDNGVDVTMLDADTDFEEVAKLRVRSLPTMVVGEERYIGAEQIINYLEGK